MPGKSIVMAVVLSGWLIAAVIACMIVAYASFFGVGVVGLMIWFVSTRVDSDQEGAVSVGVCASSSAAIPETNGADADVP